MPSRLYFDWAISTLFGWGVYGLNLLRHWPRVAGASAFSLAQIHLESLAGMDPLGLRAIAQALVDSDEFRIRRGLQQPAGEPLDGIVLHSLGNKFRGSTPPRDGGTAGRRTAGVIFFENTDLPDAANTAAQYDLLITGSSWNEAILRERGVSNVATVIQGIEPALFHVAPRAGGMRHRFTIFSGGKLERRKGQDLVLLAFRAFAERHSEAVLVTSWHSPWPVAALTLNGQSSLEPVAFTSDGRLDPTGWAVANGIDPEQFIDLGTVPNHLMGRVLSEMDVAVFPNLCEGGTNLVAMECMACGVPTILADNTGQRDLVHTGAPYPLHHQRPISLDDFGTEGWGVSNVDEIVEALEHVHANRDSARRRGLLGASAMAAWNWENQIGRLRDVLIPQRDRVAA